MSTHRVLVAVLSVGVVAGCSTAEEPPSSESIDIAKIGQVASTFGPEFQVTEKSSGLDPKALENQKPPAGVKFEPADCAEFASMQTLPDELKGNMSAVIAEGMGNRLVAIALETSEQVPLNTPTDNCKKFSYVAGGTRGTIESVPAPQIDGVETLGVHRVVQAAMNGQVQTGEVYSYIAHLGDYQVIVTANPLVVPDKPTEPVDTARAEKLLSDAVAAIRS
ncbi:hypothetical protein MCHIJ_23880 [Mycolicibacterium chitae]|uniref:DUF5642 family protein n=2 Tax=Mycolicibacterium TaxID=1866885 RepID=UPI000F835D82|nr:DUF5642 family protein [Mycolicibacterium chitae]MCV7107643.1 DUF5642 family protein [Mycolicibacterium chitae]BBZ02951.1 hypothetical protein MCHIJ_23880 [Mycolicibacterium chitae]